MKSRPILSALLLLISSGLFAADPPTHSPIPAYSVPQKQDEQADRPFKVPTPLSSRVEGLALPDDFKVTTKQRAITITADCKGEVGWYVHSPSGAGSLQVPLIKSIVIFPNDAAEDITVLCYASVDNKPVAARTVIKVENTPAPGPQPPGPQPGPQPPGPQPPGPAVDPHKPAPFAGTLNVLFVVDFNKQTFAIAAVINNGNLRRALAAKNCPTHVIRQDDPIIGTARLGTWIQNAGGLPCVLIQALDPGGPRDGEILIAEPIKSVDQIIDAVARARGAN